MTTLKTLEDKLASLEATRSFVANEIATLYKEMKQYQPQPKNMAKALFPVVCDFNCIITDTKGDYFHWSDTKTIFGIDSEDPKDMPKHYYHANSGVDIWTILVDSGAFESKGQARKNWQGIKMIPDGYTELGPIGKSKLMIFIWNPSA